MQKIVLATTNQGKVLEFKDLFKGSGLKIIPQMEYDLASIEETGLTFIENALLKARYAGLNASDSENIKKLLHEMKEVPNAERGAQFHCVLVYLKHPSDASPGIFHGKWSGMIASSYQESKKAEGFGYDPVFYLPELKRTAAELSIEEKSAMSHRGQALRQFLDLMRNV
ncbi:non-canonical purine NTP pyrophosphatase [Candidatus Williamhamiltonella defendens]|uniref:Non-canonical purine NTP pyrophosphatase n=1 Tax=Candidatus Hamiltonella defensa (Bemisia tabaci) TaxID=672795 RepID=A0A249E0K3_9ENTR|nr:non-canonical purine NTP pyrophosphatase [Candidatus Hamiltonella defensa]ASX26552.1 non-canonical purine NTP pyrophosphatase [Candidatus Hamiltonella defensa (Bemisia tabaci)]CED78436.1 Non-canonical purine NTP pyrophosphatase [Candidatus Hamiltonella defensa (Bemisia tabaci)]